MNKSNLKISKLRRGGIECFILFLNKRIQDKSNMYFLYVLLISTITGYSQPKTNTFFVDNELIPYVVKFERELNKRGVEIDWNYQDIRIKFSNIRRPDILGIAYGMNNNTNIAIGINIHTWKYLSDNQKLLVMWHELAHDLFNYKHYDIELMMTAIPEYVGSSDLNRVVNELAKDLLDNQNKWNIIKHN